MGRYDRSAGAGESRSKRDGWSAVISNASSDSLGRRSVPSVVVNEVAGAEEEREEDNGATPLDVDHHPSSISSSTSIGVVPITIRPQLRESADVHMGSAGSLGIGIGMGIEGMGMDIEGMVYVYLV